MQDVKIGDFSTNPAENATVISVDISEAMQAGQIDDAIRRVLAVLAGADFGTTPIKADTISESTADAGVTIDGLLIKDGGLPGVTFGDIIPVGTVRHTIKSTPDAGWLMLNGDTLGSATSAAIQNSDSYEALFTLFWDELADTEAMVSGGRGASAAEDWAANKTITVVDAKNRMMVVAGDSYVAGETGGAATHTNTVAEMAPHGHPYRHCTTTQVTARAGNTGGILTNHLHVEVTRPAFSGSPSNTAGQAIGGSGGGLPYSIMNPFWAGYLQIKY